MSEVGIPGERTDSGGDASAVGATLPLTPPPLPPPLPSAPSSTTPLPAAASHPPATRFPAAPIPARPPLIRPDDGRMIAGVAAAVAHHLGLQVRVVRLLFAISTLFSGAGLVLYIWLWAMVPSGGPAFIAPVPRVPAPSSPPQTGSQAPTDPGDAGPPAPPPAAVPLPARAAARRRQASTRIGDLLAGALLLTVGMALLVQYVGWQVPIGAALPLIVAVGGAALIYTQLDEVQESRWAPERPGRWRRILRLVIGMVLVLGGVLLAVIDSSDVAYAGRVLVAVAAMLGGAIVVLAPWGVRFWRDLNSEREARAREAERADIAAHLHDSVLQTLALIQRNSGDSAQITRLARAQERELRSWLYGGARPGMPQDGPARLESSVKRIAAEVEDRHGVAVDVVVVGDREVDERGQALLAALREATVNAVRHAGAPVTVYAEAGPDGVEASVRDRGPGFDLSAVAEDRHGVRQSIIARMERHGGSAEVRTTAGEGTDVRLVMPDVPLGQDDGQAGGDDEQSPNSEHPNDEHSEQEASR